VAMEELVNAGAPKLFFEAFQVQKKIGIATLEAEQEDAAAIVTAISNQVSSWLNEFQRVSITGDSSTNDHQRARAERFSESEAIAVSEDKIITPVQRTPPESPCMADVSPAIEPSPVESEDAAIELKSIGEALIAIAGSKPLNNGRNTQALKDLVTRLCLLLPRILNAEFQTDGAKEGRV
jgi:hypothetical protein